MASALGKAIAFLMKLRDAHAGMSLMQAIVLLELGNRDGQALFSDLRKHLEFNSSTVSKQLAILGTPGFKNTKGLELITVEIPPNDRRDRLLKLTPKGKRFVKEIEKILDE
jgi:DNA-binding MarR family transcriptional regulator